MILSRVVLAAICCLGAATAAAAQQTSISGIVLDQDQATVARATVTATLLPSGVQRAATSGPDGRFTIEPLQSGRYLVEIRAGGFGLYADEVVLGAEPLQLTATLQVAGVTEELTVRGAAAATVGKIAVPLKDQPLTINTINADFLKTYAINDTIEALQNVPNVYAYQQYGIYEYYTFRGFNDSVTMVDGIRSEGNRVRSGLSNVERIEVLKGPASVLGGSESIGGTVNYVLKKPSLRSAYEGEISVGSFNTARTSGGATGRLGSDALLYRLDFGFDKSDGFRHDASNKVNLTPTLSWRISDEDQIEARYTYNRNDMSGDGGIPQLTTANGQPVIPDVPRDRRYNTPQDYGLSTIHNIRVQYSRALGNSVALRNVTGGYVFDDDYWVAETLTVTPPSTVNRGFLYFKHHRRPWTNQAELTGHVRFGVAHDLLAGWDRQDYSNFTTRSNAASVPTTPIDLYDPVETHVTRTDFSVSRLDYTDVLTNSFYVQDQMTLAPQLKAVFGLRGDFLERATHNNPVTAGVETEVEPVLRESKKMTYRGGLVYQPLTRLDIYAQTATSFRPNYNLQPDGSTIDPEYGRMYEAGHRLRLAGDRLSFGSAVFLIEKRNVANSRPGGFWDIAGKIRSKGVEADVDGRINRSWLVRGGYGYTDAKNLDYVTTSADFSGKLRTRAPRHSVNFSTSYAMSNGLALSLGGRMFTKQFLNDANTLSFDGYSLFDATVSYLRGRVQYSLAVKNLTDAEYWASTLGQRQFYPGEPRRVMATVRVLTN